jgi:hypothetical protein
MPTVLDTVRDALGAGGPWLIPAVTAVAVLAALAVLTTAAVRLRGRSLSVKKTIGTAAVQAIVAWIVITGVVAYCTRVMHMPTWPEAYISALGIIACTWAGAGRVVAHGLQPRSAGWGKAGPFFWGSVAIGGVLAVLGSETVALALGRACLIVLDAWLWYLQLSEVTTRGTSRWRWTPTRFLVAIGARHPDGSAVEDSDAWIIAKLVRATRRRNSRYWPWSAIGKRTLDRLGDRVDEKTMARAMRRYAAGRVLVDQTATDSPLMNAAITAVTDAQTAAVTAPLVVVAEVGRAIGPKAPTWDEPPVAQWAGDQQSLGDAPVSPATGGPSYIEQITKWRTSYAEAVIAVRDLWRDSEGRDWATADDPPSISELRSIMQRPEINKWTGQGTLKNIRQVIIADREDAGRVVIDT